MIWSSVLSALTEALRSSSHSLLTLQRQGDQAIENLASKVISKLDMGTAPLSRILADMLGYTGLNIQSLGIGRQPRQILELPSRPTIERRALDFQGLHIHLSLIHI